MRNVGKACISKQEVFPFTWIRRQVLEVHRLTDLTVRWPPELHLHPDWLGDVGVAVRRRAKHDGHLSVHIRLGEGAFPLPGVLEEADFNVLCKSTKTSR